MWCIVIHSANSFNQISICKFCAIYKGMIKTTSDLISLNFCQYYYLMVKPFLYIYICNTIVKILMQNKLKISRLDEQLLFLNLPGFYKQLYLSNCMYYLACLVLVHLYLLDRYILFSRTDFSMCVFVCTSCYYYYLGIKRGLNTLILT